MPLGPRLDRRVLIRTDGAGGTHEVARWLTTHRLQYSPGVRLNPDHAQRIPELPKRAGCNATGRGR